MLQRDDGGRHIPSVHMKDEGASGWGDWAPPCDIYAHVPAGTSAYVTVQQQAPEKHGWRGHFLQEDHCLLTESSASRSDTVTWQLYTRDHASAEPIHQQHLDSPGTRLT